MPFMDSAVSYTWLRKESVNLKLGFQTEMQIEKRVKAQNMIL